MLTHQHLFYTWKTFSLALTNYDRLILPPTFETSFSLDFLLAGDVVLVGCHKKSNKAILQVWDNGIGIQSNNLKWIFDKFAHAGNVPLGTGMGLGLLVVNWACLCLRHAQLAWSQPGQGLVFSIKTKRWKSERTESKT